MRAWAIVLAGMMTAVAHGQTNTNAVVAGATMADVARVLAESGKAFELVEYGVAEPGSEYAPIRNVLKVGGTGSPTVGLAVDVSNPQEVSTHWSRNKWKYIWGMVAGAGGYTAYAYDQDKFPFESSGGGSAQPVSGGSATVVDVAISGNYAPVNVVVNQGSNDENEPVSQGSNDGNRFGE